MLLTELLDHDLHRSKGGPAVPYVLHVPVPPDSFPAVVSGTKGDFVVASGLHRESHLAAVGVFKYDSDKLDGLLGKMLEVAHGLSDGRSYTAVRKEKSDGGQKAVLKEFKGAFKNSFRGPKAAKAALAHIRDSSGLKAQPHICLIPSAWEAAQTASFFGDGYDPDRRKFSECCRVIAHDVPMPVFFSRPDMVGLYTQFLGGGAAIILHNVELGLAFCPQD